MAQDPVLQREMFNPRDRSAKGSGITSMVDDGSSGMTREERLQMAKDMLAEAQMKQSPEYYFKTLAQGDRPAMTRPVASSAPPPAMQPMPAMQQMAQMQAAGVRPVGMADGGIVRRGFFAGGLNTVDPRTLTPQQRIEKEKRDLDAFNMRMSDLPASENLFLDQTPEEMRTITKANPTPFDPYQMEGGLNEAVTYNRAEDPSTWTPDFKEAMIDKIYKEELSGIQSITERAASAGMIVEKPSREKIARDIENKAASIRSSRKETPATTDASARERAMPNVAMGEGRDFAGDRLSDTLRRAEDPYYGYGRDSVRVEDAQQAGRQKTSSMETSRREEGVASLARINEDQARRDQAMPDKRDYDQERLARREAIRIPGDPTMPGKATTIPGIPGAAAARDAVAQGQAGAGGGAAAQEPAKYSATTTLESIKSERAKEREDNFNMALIQAGLAMMGGKSSNALANIGEGGMQGIKQFAEQERESSRGYREDVKGIRDEERSAAALAESRRQFGITSGLEQQRINEAISSGKDTRDLAAELGRGRLDLETRDSEKRWGASDAKLALDVKLADNLAAFQKGNLDIQGLTAANAKAETDSQIQYRKDQVRLEERKQQIAENKLPDDVLSAGAYGGWKPDGKGTPPTDEQILRGLTVMSEDNLNKSLEKIINGPFVDQELKDKASERFKYNLDKLNNQGSSSVDYNTLPK